LEEEFKQQFLLLLVKPLLSMLVVKEQLLPQDGTEEDSHTVAVV
jgi:hypothetical protein